LLHLAGDLELAEWGYNRDGESLPQINLALVSKRNRELMAAVGVPLPA
jgi:transposase